MNVGGSASISVVGVGEDIIIGGETTGRAFWGQATKVTFGLGTPGAELHTSFPVESHITNVISYHGKGVPLGVNIDYFNDLSCPIKEKLQADLEAEAARRKAEYDRIVNSKSARNRTHSSGSGRMGRR